MEVLKCPNCGGKMKTKNSACEYCGTSFHEKKSKIEETIDDVKTSATQHYTEFKKNGQPVHGCLIVLAFIGFWPLGVFLLIYNANLNKKKDGK